MTSAGRSIGFPTANIALGSLQLPAFGVYAVEVDLEEDNAQNSENWQWCC